MKLATIALATAFALSGTLAFRVASVSGLFLCVTSASQPGQRTAAQARVAWTVRIAYPPVRRASILLATSSQTNA
jgi:hypothetical protein